MYLAVALDGLGSHPAAHRTAGQDPAARFDPGRVVELARLAERGRLDLLTVDGRSADRPDPGRPYGALDAWLVLALVAAHTEHIALVGAGYAKGDPLETAARVATLDRICAGRGGWQPRVVISDEQRRRATADPLGHVAFTEERFARVTDFVAAVTDAWASWPEGGRPRPLDTPDRYATVPVPVDGPPLTAVLAHFRTPYQLAVRYADVVFVTPRDRDDVLAIRAELAGIRAEVGRTRPLAVLADLNVVLAGTVSAARKRQDLLDAYDSGVSDAAGYVGDAAGLADLLTEWHRDGGVDGFRLRPAVLPDDLVATVHEVVPLLQERGLFETTYPGPLRTRLRRGSA
ncbi:LLM class flavin-dependent oxidoreductase [Micromonospora cathayae]|uniref:LLM class flavin-dependent oxidoreductase n=1 Tax=Micromonospora cathayae TaxID=3028804 RepID=A0ABY7ZX01_9ACTN|nr:LLM class flavin-dependent oxidoreductase [Micromonospora sp. HUAS 3]WDZ86543.1 LLM class flavin-dependent oxidoreductase [Micromonospora sp. HUAS 3]